MLNKTINSSLRKILIASLTLGILVIIYFFPKNESHISESLSYVKTTEMPIFLIDKNNYVARTTIIKNNKDIEGIISEIIDTLTIGGKKSSYIRNNFKALIPKNTRLINFSLKDGLLKLNFSKELLNVSKENEEKMLESIIYSLTELNNIKKIMIFVESKQLTNLPKTQKKLPNLLDKSYGINKIYNLDSIKDTSKTTIYYLSKDKDFYYYVPVTTIENDKTEPVEIIINNLKSTPVYQTNLISYLQASANLLNYQILENSISLSFNNKILANLDEKNILEEVKYSIALSIRDTYDIKNVIFNVDDEKITEVSAQ